MTAARSESIAVSPCTFFGSLVQTLVQTEDGVSVSCLSVSLTIDSSCVRNAEAEGSTPFRSTRHKASGQGYVTIDGREQYLGKYGSAESKEKYARLIAERFSGANGDRRTAVSVRAELTVDELVLRYWTGHVENYYCRDGKPTHPAWPNSL